MKAIRKYTYKLVSAFMLTFIVSNNVNAITYSTFVWPSGTVAMYATTKTETKWWEPIVYVHHASELFSSMAFSAVHDWDYYTENVGTKVESIHWIPTTPSGDLYMGIGEHFFLEYDGNSFIEFSNGLWLQ